MALAFQTEGSLANGKTASKHIKLGLCVTQGNTARNLNAASRGQMQNVATQMLKADEVAQAALILGRGGLVAFPSETVYGLGADARNGQAVAQVYAAKGRPSFNPLIVHVGSLEAAQTYVDWTSQAQALAQAFWPGPLTLVLPLKPDHGLSGLVTAGLDTLAIRQPAHPVMAALLAAFDGPIAGPSANTSGRISPTRATHVMADLNGKIDAVLDGGPCEVGLESTIIGLSGAPTLLRAGGIPTKAIEQCLGQSLASDTDATDITAPGQMQSHYAPRATVRLNATSAEENEVLLGFGTMECDLNLSPAGNVIEAAANLFEHLHQLDRTGKDIAVAQIPDTGIGQAINDRLKRAAAPR